MSPITFKITSSLTCINFHTSFVLESRGMEMDDSDSFSGRLRVLELYSGIGGMHWALKESGVDYDVVQAMDVNTSANAVYQHSFPHVTICSSSITKLTVKQLEKWSPNTILMSPPCQPFTRVGKKQDCQDPRTESFLHLLDLLRKVDHKPEYILVENVKGFEVSETRSMLLDMLQDCKYSYQEFLLTPLQFGVPNCRMRYYLIAKLSPLEFAFWTSDKIQSEVPVEALPWLRYRQSSEEVDNQASASPPAAAAPSSKCVSQQSSKSACAEWSAPHQDSASLLYQSGVDGRKLPVQSGEDSSNTVSRMLPVQPGTDCSNSVFNKSPVQHDSDSNSAVSSMSQVQLDTGSNNTVSSVSLEAEAAVHRPWTSVPCGMSAVSSPGDADQSGADCTGQSTQAHNTESHCPYPANLASACDRQASMSHTAVGECNKTALACADDQPSPNSVSNHTGSLTIAEAGRNMRHCEEDDALVCCDGTRLHDYLENADEEYFNKFLLPDKDLRMFVVMDVVHPSFRKSSCFTKRYGHYVEGAGSLVMMTDDVQIVKEASDFKSWAVEHKNRQQWGETELSVLRRLKLRYFTPREVASLLCFPPQFEFPDSVSVVQSHRLLGNSLNVHVVATLIRLMLMEPGVI